MSSADDWGLPDGYGQQLGTSTEDVLAYLDDPDNLWRRTALALAITLDPQEDR